MKHQLPELPWSKSALKPYISEETIEYHYGKHHNAYVNNLNKQIEGTEFADMALEDIIKKASGGVFNQAAQHFNHSFYWQSMTPDKTEPSGALHNAIKDAFGDVDAFLDQFVKTAATTFGSGWTWLIQGRDGKLAIQNTHDGDTPVREGLNPLLTVDMWEHAFYIDYRNDKGSYLENFKKIVNWNFVSKNFGG